MRRSAVFPAKSWAKCQVSFCRCEFPPFVGVFLNYALEPQAGDSITGRSGGLPGPSCGSGHQKIFLDFSEEPLILREQFVTN